jgi:hypothetical protein
MDFMNEGNAPLGTILTQIEKKLNDSQISNEPFNHITFNIDIDSKTINELFNIGRLKTEKKTVGRLEYDFPCHRSEEIIINSIGKLIKEKLNLQLPTPTSHLNGLLLTSHRGLWIDDDSLNILDIHLDYLRSKSNNDSIKIENINNETQLGMSMHIYLPDDDMKSELGTSLYTVPEDVKKIMPDPPVSIPTMVEKIDEDKCNLVKTIPYIPGNIFIHATSTDTWHQAPKVPKGYLRKSMMIRWVYNLVSIEY